ncbi:hypothetical protein RJ641_034405 [Dillenia turbinata]|uniref:Uncharacterized protein n=1 Tax=Dillenia turbinata TaxID=194707 RepID=A0AAN8VHN5_9MAGN
MRDQENIPPEKNAHQTTPGKVYIGAKKELGNGNDMGPRRRQFRMMTGRNMDHPKFQNGGGVFLFGSGDDGSRSSSAYSDICTYAAHHFARICEVLVERSVTSTLNSGFLTPSRDRLVVALGLDLFAVSDEKFMDMFASPGAIDILQNERQSLQKRQKILQSCLNEFKNVARAL